MRALAVKAVLRVFRACLVILVVGVFFSDILNYASSTDVTPILLVLKYSNDLS